MTNIHVSFALAVTACGVGLGACTETLPPLEGTASLKVAIVAPTELGSNEARLPAAGEVTISLEAYGQDGALDTSFAGTIDIYAQFLGTLTPTRGTVPLTTIDMANGVAGATVVALPPVFGPTFIWAEHAEGDDATWATGTSPVLWFEDPFTRDLQRPVDENALNALETSPLANKQVRVSGSRFGATGRLVVTGVYTQGYTVSDVECQDAAGTPPCVAGDYDHAYIFTFSRPRDENGNSIVVGQFIQGYAGSVQDFNGLTELSFPQTFATAASAGEADVERVPEPPAVTTSWFSNNIMFERQEAGLIKIENATVCPLDDDWIGYKQWKLDLGLGCGKNVINVITTGIVGIDPEALAGTVVPRVVGSLRPVNIGTFNVWIIYPRDAGDVVTN